MGSGRLKRIDECSDQTGVVPRFLSPRLGLRIGYRNWPGLFGTYRVVVGGRERLATARIISWLSGINRDKEVTAAERLASGVAAASVNSGKRGGGLR